MQRVAILSTGVWQLRDAIREITGFEPVRWLPPFQRPEFGCVVGWGLKPTSTRARELSIKTDASYIALEDGFIRSIEPGPDEPPLSLVVDRLGVHYDANAVSELEVLITRSAYNQNAARLARAARGVEILQANAISKFNHAPSLSEAALGLDPGRRQGRVLVIDQTRGDSSIDYGCATAESFHHMLRAARAENPGAEIVVKLHPEVVSGRKKGHLSDVIDDGDTRVVRDNVNPWSLIEAVDKIYVVTSQMGLEGLLAGRQVVCFGAPFYAGWGLTDDRVSILRRRARPSLEQLFAAIYFDYSRYISPETCREISFEEAVRWLIERKASSARPSRIRWLRRAAGSVLRPDRWRQPSATV